MAEEHETLSLEILTPEKPFLVKQTTMVVVPSQDGDCGVLVGMAPLLCALRAGVVCLFDEKLDAVERYFVPSGTAWITRERVVLLVPEILELARIDPHATREEIRKLEAQKREEERGEARGEGRNEDRTTLLLEVLRQKHEAISNIPYA